MRRLIKVLLYPVGITKHHTIAAFANSHRLLFSALIPFLAIALLAAGCVKDSARDSNLTPGMVKKHVYPGRTTQTEVLEIFGPPDLVTSKSGKEVWTYDKISQEVTASQGFITILIAGYSKSRQRSSNRSIMLILYFDKKERVEDYKLSAAKF